MAQVPSATQSRFTSGLYAWLAERERRAVSAGGVLADPVTGTSYDGTPERLAALRRGEPVELPLSALPPWARPGETLRWWRRVVVSADGSMFFQDDDGAAWLAERDL